MRKKATSKQSGSTATLTENKKIAVPTHNKTQQASRMYTSRLAIPSALVLHLKMGKKTEVACNLKKRVFLFSPTFHFCRNLTKGRAATWRQAV